MDVIEKITGMITPSLDAMGYDLVQLKLSDAARRKTLTLMAERKDGRLMSFDDCTDISHTVSALMDVEDPITSAYDLEVCSPGLDRPLVKFDDFVKYKGYEIKLETLIPVEGRKRFRGKVEKAKDDVITLRVDADEAQIPFSNIRSAKLVVTDDLVKSFLKQQKKQQTQA